MNKVKTGSLSAVALLSLAATALPVSAAPYTLVNIGTLSAPNNLTSRATGINASGQISGTSTGVFDSGTNVFPSHAFRYSGGTAGTLTDLGSLSNPTPGEASSGLGINSTGVVVGTSLFSTGPTTHAVQTTGDTLTDIGTLDTTNSAANSTANAVNDTGVIVGSAVSAVAGTPQHAFVYNSLSLGTSPSASPGMFDLGVLPGATLSSNAFGINNSGVVVGQSSTTTAALDAVVWSPNGTITDLGTLGGATAKAIAISNSGKVVGSSNTGSTAGTALQQHAFTATVTGTGVVTASMTGIDPSDYTSTANGVNNLGAIVGTYKPLSTSVAHAFLYTLGGGLVDLNTLLSPADASSFVLSSALGINDAGNIVGFGTFNGNATAFELLAPIVATPEPGSMAVLLVGMAGLGALTLRARRRNAEMML